MSPGGKQRNLALGVSWKIGIPLLLGLVALVAAQIGGISGRSALDLAAVVAIGLLLVLLAVEFEVRLLALHERMDAGLRALYELVSADIQKIGRSAELVRMIERSALDTDLLTSFVETAGRADVSVIPLLERLARREIERATWFVRQLPGGSKIAYDGEDREWLLGLTEEAEHSINAISLSTVDAGMHSFDGGLWTSDLGTRYLDLQREAVARNVAIRRIFLIENAALARDEAFLEITQLQRAAGVQVRMLNYELIPDALQSMIFDFIVFDGALSYEATPAAITRPGNSRPAMVRTLLAPDPEHVQRLERQFEQLWAAADPARLTDR